MYNAIRICIPFQRTVVLDICKHLTTGEVNYRVEQEGTVRKQRDLCIFASRSPKYFSTYYCMLLEGAN